MTERIKNMSEILQTKIMTEPEMFSGPLNSFLSQFERMKTDSALISSLCTFGKYNGAVPTADRVRRKYLQTSSKIGVQPTAVARRKAPLGGRRALITGRPVKGVHLPEHGYAKLRQKFTIHRHRPRPMLRWTSRMGPIRWWRSYMAGWVPRACTTTSAATLRARASS